MHCNRKIVVIFCKKNIVFLTQDHLLIIIRINFLMFFMVIKLQILPKFARNLFNFIDSKMCILDHFFKLYIVSNDDFRILP